MLGGCSNLPLALGTPGLITNFPVCTCTEDFCQVMGFRFLGISDFGSAFLSVRFTPLRIEDFSELQVRNSGSVP